MMTQKQYSDEFLANKTINDAKRSVRGELNELCTDNATYFYGNGEVIVSPADESEEEFILHLEIFRKEIINTEVRYEHL